MTTVVSDLADRAEISSLVSRYFSAIDDKRLDRAAVEAVFAAGGRVTRPDGSSLVGPEAIAAGQSESFARFRATHHVSSDHVVDLDGDGARLRANLVAMHLWADQERDPNTLETHFLAGGVLHGLVVRTDRGWRLSELSMRNTWRTGSGYAAMLSTTMRSGRPGQR
ncbi:nuclear transport factor 2 family protein [Microbispora sp. NPDC049125]|uniref:nuclear transport factor 2 family protein n=1 Tax=Microbispora sp. NPDC049125 TaxID=3154929 RepID=UPI00346628D7